MNNLTANSRTKTGKGHNRRLRAAGDVPGVIYGGDGEVSSLSVKSAELMRLLRGAHRRNTLIGLEIDGKDADPVLVTRRIRLACAKTGFRTIQRRGDLEI